MHKFANIEYLAFVFLLGITNISLAQGEVNCSEGNTLERASCLDEELTVADKALNTTYKSLLKTLKRLEDENSNLKGGLIVWLKETQRIWISYRDKNCEFYSNFYSGGSQSNIELTGCKLEMTKERLNELNKVSATWENQ
jgi:uncharacterized protein YecT (DUF1311 family)